MCLSTSSGIQLASRIFALLLATFSSSPALGQEAQSIAGAVYDGSPQLIQLDRRTWVSVWDSARNKLYEKDRRDWPELSYRYLAPMMLVPHATGQLVEVFPRRGEEADLSVRIRMVDVDREKLMGLLEKNSRKIVPSVNSIGPLEVESVTYSLTACDSAPQRLPGGGMGNLSHTHEIEFQVPVECARSIAERVKRGLRPIKAVARIRQMTSALDQLTVSTDRLTKTDAWRKYAGPAGPQFITATQAVDAAVEIAHELDVFRWVEGDPQSQQEALFEWVLKSLIDLTPKERSLSSPDWAKGLRVDVSDFTKLTNLTTSIAFDAGNMKQDDWCRKYKQENQNKNWLDRQRGLSGGGSFFGLIKAKGSGTSNKKTGSENRVYKESEDCGKYLTEHQFKYEFTGQKWIPKAIYVYETLSDKAEVTRRLKSAKFRLRQRWAEVALSFEGP